MTWEMPEKVIMSEESVAPISRALTPPSHRSSGSLRTPKFSPSSTDPIPLPRRESGHQWNMDAGWINKGKEKEVIPATDGEADTPGGSVDDDSKDKSGDKEETRPSPASMSTETIIKSQPKSSRVSMQQRLRQFWPAKVRGKSLDKTELAQEYNTNDEGHARDQ
ncbi:hypothetical protein O1611_g8088 [Lasiodiplodia mahajangana]|uniref:Uncharacterized protein n=1 Tax=Lasiodiplodia mahajangana TaxID=1108764 RepID=A0ACC2JDK0_9PEZI|nr:hypothetical protein O1611_g8088 [Lasiodiplodia mahajangana]